MGPSPRVRKVSTSGGTRHLAERGVVLAFKLLHTNSITPSCFSIEIIFSARLCISASLWCTDYTRARMTPNTANPPAITKVNRC